jgi:hypothetical protein
MYYKYAEKAVKNRFYAIKAVKSEGLTALNYDTKLIFSDKNTNLITELVGIDKQEEVIIDYKDYIKTDIPEFDEFVTFVNNNQKITDDNELKRLYKEQSGNEVALFTLNNCDVTGGFGGAHGAIPKYKNNEGNLYQLDYTSQYPSVILQYKNLFKKIMNVKLYEAVYNLRLKYKNLKKDAKKQGNKELEIEYDNIQNGLKLILNSTYGLINSTYKIKLANKVLGRFICFKGQELLYNLCKRNPDIKTPNINTDGVYFILNSLEEGKTIADIDYKINDEGYFKIEVDKVEWLIQNDVNNYILKLANGEIKQKGSAFNLGIKQMFNKTSNIDVNVKNAINLICNKDIEMSKVYFKGMSNIDCNKPHYFTTKDKGINPVNTLKHPTKLSIDDVDIFVTEDISDANITVYKELAELTKTKILNFTNKATSNKYFEHILTTDTDDNNNLFKQNINRIKKLLDIETKHIGYSGFMGNSKAYTFVNGKAINPLINYKKSEIRDSIESQGIVVNAPEKLIIIDVDIYDKKTASHKAGYPKQLVEKLANINTYKTWNTKTKDYSNFKLVFKNDINKILDVNSELKQYIEVLDTAVVWTMAGLDRQYFDNNTEILNISEFDEILKEFIVVKHDDAKKHVESKETKEKHTITESNDVVINTLLNMLRGENIDIFTITEDEKGLHLATSCPCCCSKKSEHYKNNYNKIDAYINLNENNSIRVHNLSNSCKEDKAHTEFYQELNDKFQKLLPDNRELENIKLFHEIKTNIDVTKILDNSFFIENTVKIVGTGGGKTFQTASKLAYNLFHENKFTIVTTKQNSNIADFERTFKKVINLSLNKHTKLIDAWLESENKGLECLFVHKLKNVNPIDKEGVNKLKGIVTNHKYFYNNGHLAEFNKNMMSIRDEFKNVDMEIIIDEYESFKDMGVITIPLNDFYNYKLDIDTNDKIWIKAYSCLYPCIKKLIEPSHAYVFAKENTKQVISENEGIHTYKLDDHGTKDIKTEFYLYCEEVGKVKYDCSRRTPSKIKNNLYYVVCDKVQQHKLKENIVEDGLKNNFRELLSKTDYIAVVTQIVKISNEEFDIENFDIQSWGTELSSMEDLINYCKELKDLSSDDFSQFKNKLYQTANEIYINNLALSVKSILNSFHCPKYYLTANIIEDNNLAIDTTLAYQSGKAIKNIDIALIDRTKANDKAIIENLDLLKHADFKTLTFVSLAKNLKTIINQNIDIDTNHIVIKSVVNEGEKSVNVDTRQCEDIDDSQIKTTTLAYINGTESQGRNYSNSELLILNGTVDINVKGRLTKNSNNEITVKSIETASAEKLRQAFGRIFRGDYSYKAMVILGDYSLIKSIIDGYSDKYSIKFNLEKYNKTTNTSTLLRKGLSDIIEFYGSKFAEINDNSREQREIEYFNADLRSKGGNTKVDGEEVYNYYISLVDKYYNDNGKKPKDIELIPEIIEKFGIKNRQFKTIKSKYKV